MTVPEVGMEEQHNALLDKVTDGYIPQRWWYLRPYLFDVYKVEQ